LSVILGTAALTPPVQAQGDFVSKVNAPFQNVPKDKRSELVILPALSNMETPPAEANGIDKAVLLLPSSGGWDAAVKWAQATPQREVLKALAEVTEEEDYHIAMVFAQGYGVEEVADYPDLIANGMYTELGDPPTLATAKFGYLQKMNEMQYLSNIEATRLVHEGNFVAAIDVMFDYLYFARQLAERPMLKEKKQGMLGMRQALERIRDIVYQDQRSEKQSLGSADLRKYVERLEANKGYLGVNRIPLPRGTVIAADQVLHRVLVERGGVNDDMFAVTLARVASTDRPLRLLSESAYWEKVGRQHEGWFVTREMLAGKNPDKEIGGLLNDWIKRWELGPHDPYTKLDSDYRKHVARGPKFAALRAVLDGIEDLFPLKIALQTEVAGTRMALSIYGFYRQNNAFPPDISAIRPRYVPVVDIDPYSPAKKPLGYFVPIRDDVPRQDPRRNPQPWLIKCYPPKPYNTFEIPLRADTFVLFSVGPDGVSVNAKDATQYDPELEGDYLLWPPMLSLGRQDLLDRGQLK
jgi:hypothetical protein